MVKKTKKAKKIKRTKKAKSTALTTYERMDLFDEQQIVDDINGRIPDAATKMVYSFLDKQSGKEITGLSWYGSKAAEREFNRRKLTQISITDKAIISQGNGYVDVGVYAYDAKNKMGSWGFSRGFDQGKRRDGSAYEDRFPSAKAASKAQRNAVNNLLPAEKVAKMIQAWIKRGNVQKIEAPKGEVSPKQETQNDWISKLKAELYRMGARNEIAALKILQTRTKLILKNFNIPQKNAQIAYMMLLNETGK